MQKLKFFLIALIIILTNLPTVYAGFDKDDIFSPPSMPDCPVTSLQFIAQNGDCILFEGEVIFASTYSAIHGIVNDSGFWFRSSFISQTNFGPIAGIVKIDNITRNIENRNSFTNNSSNLAVTEAYISFAINDFSFIKMGLIPISIASSKYNSTENYLGLTSNNFNISAGKEFFLDCSYSYNYSCKPPYTDYAVQLFSGLGNDISLAFALEDLAGRGKFVGVINYTDSNFEGQLSVIADEFFYIDDIIWRFHAGASISLPIVEELIVKLGAIWHEHNLATQNSERWQIATAIEAKLSEQLTFIGEVGIDGKTGSPMTVAYSSAELKWELKDNLKASIKGWGNEEGAYSFTFLMSKKFK